MIDTILFVLFALGVGMILGSMMMLVRNEQVARLRHRWLNEEYLYRQHLISERRPPGSEWLREDALPTYNQMMNKFWRNPESFFRPLSDFYWVEGGRAPEFEVNDV